ncbi:MAG: glycosyltransferase family 87 protein [Deltaproteobacteria bacterium]
MRHLRAAWILIALAAGVACALHPLKAVDLRVYYAAAQSYFLESGPLYGATRAFAWPMIYRYPPLFIGLFRPLGSLPLAVVVGFWATLKVLFLGFLVRAWYRRYPPRNFPPALAISALLFLPYLIYDLQIGNVQFFLVAMVCLALLICGRHPILSSLLIGLAAAVKVWPAFVIPFLFVRRRWRVGSQALGATVVFTLAPVLWLGWETFFDLFRQWFLQEQRINALLGDRWYPSQSLRGVMLRFLTQMDYAGLPDRNYRHVNFVSLSSTEVRYFWLASAIALGVLALVWVYRCKEDGAAYSIFFCSLMIIEPNVAHLAYTVLLWPFLYAGLAFTDPKAPPWARRLIGLGATLAVVAPLVPGSAAQRLAQVLGVDFFSVLIPVTVGVLIYSSWGLFSPLWPWCPPAGDNITLT